MSESNSPTNGDAGVGGTAGIGGGGIILGRAGDLNREAWLTEVARRVEPIFKGFRLGRYRVTCGWPAKAALSSRPRVGECHYPRLSGKGVHEIFVSPLAYKSLEAAGILCHEIAHVAAGSKAAHGAGFVRVCNHVGLTRGKPTAAGPGRELEDRLRKIVEAIGDYPHEKYAPAIKPVKRVSSSVRLECPCGAVASMSLKWLEHAGVPTCGCGMEFVLPDSESPDEE